MPFVGGDPGIELFGVVRTTDTDLSPDLLAQRLAEAGFKRRPGRRAGRYGRPRSRIAGANGSSGTGRSTGGTSCVR